MLGRNISQHRLADPDKLIMNLDADRSAPCYGDLGHLGVAFQGTSMCQKSIPQRL
jgi:hypothetical protein